MQQAVQQQPAVTYLNHPGPILNVPTKASDSTLSSD